MNWVGMGTGQMTDARGPEPSDDTVRDIVNILARAGLNSTAEAAQGEVCHSIKCAAGFKVDNLEVAKIVAHQRRLWADIRKAQKLLRPHLSIPLLKLALAGLYSLRSKPGPRTHSLKYRCAEEALFLARALSRAKISTDENGAVYQIALLIYQANGGGPDDDDMRNVVRMAVKDWKAAGRP